MSDVLRYHQCDQAALTSLLQQLGLQYQCVADNTDIPGSFWGDDEAGLIGSTIYIRHDTPVHSVMHEACHFVCMDDNRKATLHTNAGGSQTEENAVCYLQILLSECLPDMGRAKMCADMDAWGYSFRLGSAAAWFADDAQDAIDWLSQHQLLMLADQLAHTNSASLAQ
ncbi:MAG: hypothetical protein AAF404_21810 [Pseudomonadota bacterium]